MELRKVKSERVLRILDKWPVIDRAKKIPAAEFQERRKHVWEAIRQPPYEADVGFVFSDEHYSGDVPYLFGNTNAAIEQVAGAVGPHEVGKSGIIAGFEGVYVAGQLAKHGGTVVYPTESLQLADDIYPVEGFALGDILKRIAGKDVTRIALLTPRQVLPAGILANLEQIAGGPDRVIDAQEAYQRIKNVKSDAEMDLLRDASNGTALMTRCILAAIEAVGREHGNDAAEAVRKRLMGAGVLPEGLARLKPYTGTHNAGYTECQEFYGAITLESGQPLDRQVVTMLDVSLRGRGNDYDDVVIPGFDFFVVEDTLGKSVIV